LEVPPRIIMIILIIEIARSKILKWTEEMLAIFLDFWIRRFCFCILLGISLSPTQIQMSLEIVTRMLNFLKTANDKTLVNNLHRTAEKCHGISITTLSTQSSISAREHRGPIIVQGGIQPTLPLQKLWQRQLLSGTKSNKRKKEEDELTSW
jgi:hypothetical protein